MRASAVVKCHRTLLFVPFRAVSQAATSVTSAGASGIVEGGTARGLLHMPAPRQRLEEHEQVGRAVALVLVVDGGRVPRGQRPARPRLPPPFLCGFVPAPHPAPPHLMPPRKPP